MWVRLWVDDLHSFARLCPALQPGLAAQSLDDLEVCLWPAIWTETEVADLVIEAFACHLPEAYLQAMAARTPPPTWVNLDYLTAEDWAEGCHGLWSMHPRLPLRQLFFFPGFSARSGGLLREACLLQERAQFQAQERQAFLLRLGIAPQPVHLRLSLFCYDNPALDSLLQTWSRGPQSVQLLVPEGRALGQVEQWLGEALPAGAHKQRGHLQLHALPLLPHADYDRLLWACDFNIVRGEDSFVRAQWAARPLLWHIYPQQEEAHWPKLHAFEQLYHAGLDAVSGQALRELWQAFNAGQDCAAAWLAVQSALPQLQQHAQAWAEKLALQQDLASRLVNFHQERVQSRVS